MVATHLVAAPGLWQWGQQVATPDAGHWSQHSMKEEVPGRHAMALAQAATLGTCFGSSPAMKGQGLGAGPTLVGTLWPIHSSGSTDTTPSSTGTWSRRSDGDSSSPLSPEVQRSSSWQGLSAALSEEAEGEAGTGDLDQPPPYFASSSMPQPADGFAIHGAATTDQRPEAITTLMIRNICNSLSRRGLLNAIDRLGFEGLYDFVHLPMAFGTGRNKGFAFVNFDAEQTAQAFRSLFPPSDEPNGNTRDNTWMVSTAEVQGYNANAAAAGSRKMARIRKNRYRPLLMRRATEERL